MKKTQSNPLFSPTGAVDYLRTHDAIATLLPTVKRLIGLQADCNAALPAMFHDCKVLQFDDGTLVLSMPNAALAAKLKHQLPKLQHILIQSGWQVEAIRMKIQMRPNFTAPASSPRKNLILPRLAITALSTLSDGLEKSTRNEALKSALLTMLSRHR